MSGEQALEQVTREWQAAVDRLNALHQWMKDHEAEIPDWSERFSASLPIREQLGFHRYGVGDLTRYGDKPDLSGWWAMKLRYPTEWGSWVISCKAKGCNCLQLQWGPMEGAGYCVSCREKRQQERAEIKAVKRIERRKERSAQLANRQGLCLVCKSPMTVARVTRTTCSDRCRKQWIRKGADAFPLPDAPSIELQQLREEAPAIFLAEISSASD